jgi:hypothetical protein
MAPSSPRGFAGLAELFGFGCWAWAVFSSIRVLAERFLADAFGRTENLFAAAVIGYGFYLLMTVLGLEATMKHKDAYTGLLQPLGWMATLLLVSKIPGRLWRRSKPETPAPESRRAP